MATAAPTYPTPPPTPKPTYPMPKPTTPTPLPAASTPPPSQVTAPQPNANTASSPIQLMDWEAGLSRHDENATTRQVNPNELVQNQLNSITAGGSQYLTQAADRAREEASSRGMMMSTMAAGAGSRAAIDAALPIAQQDAAQYGHVYDANMAAQNQDSLADQQNSTQLLGQAVGIRANLDEAERGRGFAADQNQLTREFTTSERMATQDFTARQQTMQNNWQAAQNDHQLQAQASLQEMQLAHDTAMRQLDENFQGTQLEKQLAQQRFQDFTQAMGNQTAMLSQTISSIYNNPNLNAQQQAAAVQNARAVYQSLFTSYATSLSGGVPPIFVQPYPMDPNAPKPKPPPPALPPPGGGSGGSAGSGGGGGGGMHTGGNLPAQHNSHL